MDKTQATGTRPAIRSEAFEWGDIHTGPREALIAAGLLLEEWIPVNKPSKNGSVETILADGRRVYVYRKGKYLEVRIDAPAAVCQERRAKRKAELAERQARTLPLRLSLRDRYFVILNALRARYPGVEVADFGYTETGDGGVSQCVTFQATIERLLACGLLTPTMLEAAREPDQRRIGSRHRTTPLGCGFLLFETDGDPLVRLNIYSNLAPHERGAIAVNDARRELARIFAGRGARRRRGSQGAPS